MLDSNEGIVNHLLHCVWWQGNNGDDKTFFKVVKEFFNWVAWIASCTPLALVHLFPVRVGGVLVVAQVVNDG